MHKEKVYIMFRHSLCLSVLISVFSQLFIFKIPINIFHLRSSISKEVMNECSYPVHAGEAPIQDWRCGRCVGIFIPVWVTRVVCQTSAVRISGPRVPVVRTLFPATLLLCQPITTPILNTTVECVQETSIGPKILECRLDCSHFSIVCTVSNVCV